MDEVTSPVLIVGGGLSGLSAAAFLAAHGVESLLVERRAAPLAHPRARAVNPRSVELYRGLGLEEAILDARSYADSPDALMIRAPSLTAQPWHQGPLSDHGGGPDAGRASPCDWAPIGQHRLEALVAERAARMGAHVRYGAELLSFRERDDGIEAVIAENDLGRRYTVRAGYLVAADGNRSPIRRRLGIPMTGPGVLGHTATFVFRADLTRALRQRRLGIGHLDRPEPGTVLLPHDDAGSWVLSIPYRPRHDGGDLSGRCLAAVRAAVGDPALEVEFADQLPGGTKVLTWEIGARVADRFRSGPHPGGPHVGGPHVGGSSLGGGESGGTGSGGRVFLAGDSAHVVPPTGALGASLGIQDVHNLAWRLAAVLGGRAGPGLLDGYEAERRPTALLTMRQAMLQMRERTGRPLPETADAEPPEAGPLEYDAVVFGYRYRSAQVVSDGHDDEAGPPAWHPRDLRGQPGTRAPHVDLVRDGRSLSTVDLFGRGFVLLAAAGAAGWAEAGRTVSAELGVDLRVHRLGHDLHDVAGDAHERYGIGRDGAVLVRPDGFVAWRAATGADRPPPMLAETLAGVLSRLLCLPVRSAYGGEAPCAS